MENPRFCKGQWVRYIGHLRGSHLHNKIGKIEAIAHDYYHVAFPALPHWDAVGCYENYLRPVEGRELAIAMAVHALGVEE